jgi:predicted DNA-binding transcriptional regulator AlpA
VPEGQSDFLSEREVGERLGVSQRTLFDLRQRGEAPPHLRVTPRRIMYPRAAVDAWMEARTVTGQAQPARNAA